MAILAVTLLASGLTGLELLPGRGLPEVESGQADTPARRLEASETLFLNIWRVLTLLIVALLPFAIIRFFISPDMRKRVLRDLLRMATVFILYYFFTRALRASGLLGGSPPETTGIEPDAGAQGPALDLIANPPDWLSYATSLGFVLLAIALAWLIWRRFRSPSNPLDDVAREAQIALDDLLAGKDAKNVIVRCYVDMCRALGAQRGVRRDEAMTAREFEAQLSGMGLPRSHVERLTRLFEGVRYGAKQSGQADEREAIACLTAIVEACAVQP